MKNLKIFHLTAVLVGIGLGITSSQGAAFIKLGDIKGEATDNEHKDWIIIESMSHGITNQRDAASGLPTGKRQHKPFTITKEIDKSSPKLMEACVNGRAIPVVRLEFVRKGEQDRYYEVIIKNVLVTSYQSGAPSGQAPTESFSLNYEEIKWTYSVWDDTDIVHVDHSYRWNLIHEVGESDRVPAGSFRLKYDPGAEPGSKSLLLQWEGFEEFQYEIFAATSVQGPYQLVQPHTPTEDGEQEVLLPINLSERFIQIRKTRLSE